MKLHTISELYQLISKGSENFSSRKETIALRKKGLDFLTSDVGFNKVAFDTRRINQETDYIPRRGLQNYHRSEKFVSDAINEKIIAFKKAAKVLNQLKLEFERNPEWQDSYTRILTSAVHKGLRTDENDGDFSDAQPSMGSLDYLEELMFVRYRMTPDNLMAMSEDELRKTFLQKDELLVRGTSIPPDVFEIKPSDVSKYSYDTMVDKMLSTMAQVMSTYKPQQPDDNLTSKLFDVKATKDAPEIERTVTITIKDKIVDKEISKTAVVENVEIKSNDETLE
jgi:hypothetical protein